MWCSASSCLSPTLFIAYFSDAINDLPSGINSALYADDFYIWAKDKSIKRIQPLLQNSINSIVNYCNKWCFSINKSKTVYTTFTTAGEKANYNKK